ncbi:hypothetical protein HHK36_005737 [Tetracentron sinense]|uniref:Wax synthase domain-containing protein n=1 Tax=Tetracentron sinense TaxID=13715 RepID=A0A834ZLJ3_TETSI|nr:hypothetical protein HHK36_005737 [Tetracentron sinense]
MMNFTKVWLSVYASLCYCYYIGRIIPSGKMRLMTILPIVCLFLILPLNLSTIHLGGTTGFFIAWLANFKLLLYSFGQGPLSSDPSISLGRFISIACLPIKIQQDDPPPNRKNKENPSPEKTQKASKSPLNYAIKGLLLALLMRSYDYSQYIHPKIILFLYCFHVYFSLEIMLAMIAALARVLLKLELEPQFDDPYLSTSLQDFWGRRWNLMVTSILRPTVYDPIRSFFMGMLGRRYSQLPAVVGTFVVSGVMHELIFFYFGRVEPTWEITFFFILHGVCLAVEIAVKKTLPGKWRLPGLVSGPLAIAFVIITAFWLFFPQFLRCNADVRAFGEFAAVLEFAKDLGRSFRFGSPKVMSA